MDLGYCRFYQRYDYCNISTQLQRALDCVTKDDRVPQCKASLKASLQGIISRHHFKASSYHTRKHFKASSYYPFASLGPSLSNSYDTPNAVDRQETSMQLHFLTKPGALAAVKGYVGLGH